MFDSEYITKVEQYKEENPVMQEDREVFKLMDFCEREMYQFVMDLII